MYEHFSPFCNSAQDNLQQQKECAPNYKQRNKENYTWLYTIVTMLFIELPHMSNRLN